MGALLLLSVLSATPLKVGTTLHPYYSWASNVAVGLPIEVRPVLPGEVDVGSYQPRPEDVAGLRELDALIVNGIGHDDFILEMLKASGNSKCRVIRPNDSTALLKSKHGSAVNSHTFLSFSNAIQQTSLIARALGELRPELKAQVQANAAAYSKRLRVQRSAAVKRIAALERPRVITVHEGYSYVLQELGVELVAVVEPAHGLLPSASELGEIGKVIRTEHVTVVLAEASFPPGLREVLTQAGAQVVQVSHIATGAFTPERFEVEMQANIDAIAKALERH